MEWGGRRRTPAPLRSARSGGPSLHRGVVADPLSSDRELRAHGAWPHTAHDQVVLEGRCTAFIDARGSRACPGPIDGAPGRPQRMTSTDLQGRAPIGITGAALRWMSWRATTVQAFRRRRRLSHNAARRPLVVPRSADGSRPRLQAPPRHHRVRRDRSTARAPRLRRGQSDAVSGRGRPRAARSGAERSKRTASGGLRRAAPVMPFGRGRSLCEAVVRCLSSGATVHPASCHAVPRRRISSDELTRSRDCCDAMLRCAVGRDTRASTAQSMDVLGEVAERARAVR